MTQEELNLIDQRLTESANRGQTMVHVPIPMARALVARVRELEAERRWIPVEERLPEVGQFVLATSNELPVPWRCAGIHRGDGDFRDGYGGDLHPSHWMPLPAPP